MTEELNLGDENSIFNYLLSRKKYNIETKFLTSIDNLSEEISTHIDTYYIPELFNDGTMFNIDNNWINTKYILLIQLQITTDLISDSMINFMENK